jgi:phosphoserine phosphatase
MGSLTELCGGASGHQINPRTIRFRGIGSIGPVESYCTEHRLDAAIVPSGRTLTDFRVLVMDMDSTLITIECIDEIADMIGIKPQVAKITEAAMRGELDFPSALRERVALLAGLEESALQKVYDERLRLSPGAETLLAGVKSAGLKTVLVSGGFTFFTERLRQRLGLDYTLANTLEVHDRRLTGRVLGEIVDANAKAARLQSVCDELGCNTDCAIAIGDGANDLKMMAAAGVGIAYHAKPIVRQQAAYSITYSGLDGVLALFE